MHADAFHMTCTLGSTLDHPEALVAISIIAAWLVLMCLKTLAMELSHAIRVHNLKIEAHTLRLAQRKRLRDLSKRLGH